MYSDICSANKSAIKGTGRDGDVCIAGRIKTWYWMPADSSFASVADATDIDSINAKVAAGELYLLGSPAEEEANDTDAEYNETTYGNAKYKTKESKKGIKIQLQESACTVAALKSFSGRNGRLMGLSVNGVWVGVHDKKSGEVRGQLTSQFDVEHLTRAIADQTELLPIVITFSDPNEYDLNRFQSRVDWTESDIDQVFDAEVITSNANYDEPTSSLTFDAVITRDCLGKSLDGVTEAQVEFKDGNNNIIAATLSGATSPYSVSVTTAVAKGTFSLKGIVNVSDVLFSSTPDVISV